MTARELISPAYVDEQRRLHAEPRGYGQKGYKWAATVMAIAAKTECASILDYGCGGGSLKEAIGPTDDPRWADVPTRGDVREYDPAIVGKDGLPEPADLVVCTDVMEHVEPEKVLAVIYHLSHLAVKRLFLVVSLVETSKALSDGRQAHISLNPAEWWRLHFGLYFEILEELQIKPEKQWVAVLRSKYPRKAVCE